MSKKPNVILVPIYLPSRETVRVILWIALILISLTFLHREQNPIPLPIAAAKIQSKNVSGPLSGDLFLPQATKPSNAQLAGADLNLRVENLLKSMTLEEKVGQLTLYSGGILTGPEKNTLNYSDMVVKGQVGSLFNVVGAAPTNFYQHLAVEKSPHHIPILFGYDVIHGQHTVFPVPLAIASTFDPDLAKQLAHVSAQEASDDGVRWVFSPMVDIARDARWGRITEGFGEDTFLDSVMADAFVTGYQGNDLSAPGAVASCVKHFAAYGAANAGREYNTVDMSELTLRQIYLPPYHAAIGSGSATVMSAFVPLNGVPATADPFLLTQILRNEWKFNGMVVSDYGAIGELINHGVASNNNVACRKAFVSGVDVDMEDDLYRTHLVGLVKAGQVPESFIDEAVRRVLRLKFALGLFDHPYIPDKPAAPVISPEKRELVRKAAEESLVLLKNSIAMPDTASVLPLDPKVGSIAVIGPLADSSVDMLGSWSAQGNPGDVVTLKQALENRFKDTKTKITYSKGTDILSDSDAGFAEAEANARQANVVIMALGESASTMTGESTSRTRLDLPGNQEELLERITALGKPTVLVLFNGRPLAIKWAAAHVPAIIEAWYPGIEAGPAVTNVLFGDVNPSGKLPVSFPQSVGQEPLFYNQLPTGRPADQIDLSRPPGAADKYFSRYIDETNAPLFPFGFGLSYTQVTYSNLELNPKTISLSGIGDSEPQVTVQADVKNTGSVPCTEVVQLYIRNTDGSLEEPVRELKGFSRVPLKAGETKHIVFNLTSRELAYYNLEMQRTIEPSNYQVWVGGSSGATLSGKFEVDF